jgi:ribosomal protein L10
MATSRSTKTNIVNLLKNDISSQKSIVFVTTKDTKKTVDSVANFDLRSKSFNSGLKVAVVKNSLIQKSFSSVTGLSGQTYMAYLVNGEDTNEVIVPKLFIKMINADFPDQFNVVGALINGEFVDASEAIKYSKVPTKDESMAMVAGALNQIAAGIARAVKAVSEKSE